MFKAGTRMSCAHRGGARLAYAAKPWLMLCWPIRTGLNLNDRAPQGIRDSDALSALKRTIKGSGGLNHPNSRNTSRRSRQAINLDRTSLGNQPQNGARGWSTMAATRTPRQLRLKVCSLPWAQFAAATDRRAAVGEPSRPRTKARQRRHADRREVWIRQT